MRVLGRAGYTLAAVFFAVPFFGLVDLLAVTGDPAWVVPLVPLEVSWGVLFTVFVAGTFAALAVRPSLGAVAGVQFGIVAVALLVCAAAGRDAGPLAPAAVLALAAVLLGRRGLGAAGSAVPPWLRLRDPLLLVAVAAAPFWAAAALAALERSRRAAPWDRDVTMGIDHWPVHAAALLTIAASAVVAALSRTGRRFLSGTASVAGALFAAASLAYPRALGALPSLEWSLVALVWALAVSLIGGTAPRAPASRDGGQEVLERVPGADDGRG